MPVEIGENLFVIDGPRESHGEDQAWAGVEEAAGVEVGIVTRRFQRPRASSCVLKAMVVQRQERLLHLTQNWDLIIWRSSSMVDASLLVWRYDLPPQRGQTSTYEVSVITIGDPFRIKLWSGVQVSSLRPAAGKTAALL